MEHVAFIINPFAADGNYLPFVEQLKRRIENPKIYISESVEGTDHFIRESFDETDIFVAIGGDGTISNVARNLINTDKTLAIFPAGSGNGFSRETHFHKDMDELLLKIRQKNFRKIDTFSVNGRLSINVSGTGFDGKVAKEFEKTGRGFRNYVKVSVTTFLNYQPIRVRFKNENLQQYDGRYLMLNVANTRQFGNNAYIAPNASKSDGLVDLVLVKKFPLHYALFFAVRMFTKALKDDEYVTYLPVSEAEFEVDTDSWHIDGEFTRISSPVRIQVNPQSLRILV